MVLTGDGSSYGMGLSATSAAIERGLDFLYICYDNEGYGNTGQQSSGATPHAARPPPATGGRGYAGFKKDLFAIWAAHRPAYAATVIGAEPLDLAQARSRRRRACKGPRLILALAPCPTGWDYDPKRDRRDRPSRGEDRHLAAARSTSTATSCTPGSRTRACRWRSI